eukprot:jgi/Galph1/4996/GphlegSOOS_G3681.1
MDESMYPLSWYVERQVAVHEDTENSYAAVCLACKLSARLQKQTLGETVLLKLDKSPVTTADFAVQAVVTHEILRAFPKDKFIAEENASSLENDDTLLHNVTAAVNSVLALDDQLTEKEICELLNRGSFEGGTNDRTWLLDPIDGTKGFLRGEQFCTALALLQNGIIRVGVLGCPNLPLTQTKTTSVEVSEANKTGCLFHASEGSGAFVQRTEKGACCHTIHVDDVNDPAWATFCESVEPGHSSHELSQQIAKILGVTNSSIQMDSQCKYGILARGQASIYFRFPKPNYQENVWDHAAGTIIIREAGGLVTDGSGELLDFSKGRKLWNRGGIVATNGKLHAAVIAVVRHVCKC